MKKSEKDAKKKLHGHAGVTMGSEGEHVAVTNRRGGGIQYNEGQAIKQGFGSGIRDIASHLRKKK